MNSENMNKIPDSWFSDVLYNINNSKSIPSELMIALWMALLASGPQPVGIVLQVKEDDEQQVQSCSEYCKHLINILLNMSCTLIDMNVNDDLEEQLLVQQQESSIYDVVILNHLEKDVVKQLEWMEIIGTREFMSHHTLLHLPEKFIFIVVMPYVDTNKYTLQLESVLRDRVLVCASVSDVEFHRLDQKLKFMDEPLGKNEIQVLQMAMEKQVHLSHEMEIFIRDITVGVRGHPIVHWGWTNRVTDDLLTVAKILAFIRGEHFMAPKHIYFVIESILLHRLVLKTRGHIMDPYLQEMASNLSKQDIINFVLNNIDTPL